MDVHRVNVVAINTIPGLHTNKAIELSVGSTFV